MNGSEKQIKWYLYMVGVDHANALARPWGEIIGEVRKLYNPNGATEE